MGCFIRKSSRTAKELGHVVCALCTAPPLPGYGHLCVSVWRFHGAPGAEGSDCHPVSQALGFCFVLGLLLGANHRVQIRDSKKK